MDEEKSICAWINTNTVDNLNIHLLIRGALELRDAYVPMGVYGDSNGYWANKIIAAIKALQAQAATGVIKPSTPGCKPPPEDAVDRTEKLLQSMVVLPHDDVLPSD